MSLASKIFDLLDEGTPPWGNNTFPLQRPENQGLPAVTFEVSDTSDVQTHNSNSGFSSGIVTVGVYAGTYTTAITSYDEVKTRLDRITSGGYAFGFESSSDTVVSPIDGSDRPLYIINMRFTVQY